MMTFYKTFTKDRAYMVNLDDKKRNVPRWVSFFIDRNTTVYFDTFEIEYITQEVLNKSKDKLILHNIFRAQSGDSVMCVFCCIFLI